VTNNEVLRSVRYLLNVGNGALVDIVRLAGGEVSKAEMAAFLKSEDEQGYQPCSDQVMAY